LTNQSNQSLTSRSLPSSCPRYSDLHRGFSPRPSIYPIHLSGSPTSNPSARSIDQSVPINQSSASLSLTQCRIDQSFISITLTHSIHLSIHPLLLPARHQSIDRSIDQSIHPSTTVLPAPRYEQPQCDRRLRLRQSIDQSINQSTNRLSSCSAHPIHRSSVERSMHRPGQSINQSISRSVQLINHSSASLSLTQSIHPLLLPARYQSIDRSVMPIN
jgi:hypothetical protein